MVLSSIYVPNLANQSHRAAIPEARRPQRLPHTDLYAAAPILGVPHFPLVLRALLRLVEHGMIWGGYIRQRIPAIGVHLLQACVLEPFN